MTPLQKLKHMILIRNAELESTEPPEGVTADNVDGLFDAAEEQEQLYDARNEVRSSGIETNVAAPHSRHYEAQSVASQAPDGSWVGWTYWYGGGKHSEPEAVDWMEDAYNLTCVEEQKMVTVRTFAKVA